jgi:competence protein ComEC
MKSVSLTHITAVSGMHISIILSAILTLMAFLGFKKIMQVLVAGIGLIIFMNFVGFSPSVWRAGVMGSIMLLSILFGRKKSSLRALGIAMIILIVQNPFITREFGFALSVVATFSIIAISPKITKFLSVYIPQNIASTISICISAQILCSPIIILFSGQVSIIGIFTNILLVPIIPFILIFGIMYCITTFAPFLYIAGFLCTVVVKAVDYLSSEPFSHLQTNSA